MSATKLSKVRMQQGSETKLAKSRSIKSLALKEAFKDLYTLDDKKGYAKIDMRARRTMNATITSASKTAKSDKLFAMMNQATGQNGSYVGGLRNGQRLFDVGSSSTKQIKSEYIPVKGLQQTIQSKISGMKADVAGIRKIVHKQKESLGRKRDKLYGGGVLASTAKASVQSDTGLVTIDDQQEGHRAHLEQSQQRHKQSQAQEATGAHTQRFRNPVTFEGVPNIEVKSWEVVQSSRQSQRDDSQAQLDTSFLPLTRNSGRDSKLSSKRLSSASPSRKSNNENLIDIRPPKIDVEKLDERNTSPDIYFANQGLQIEPIGVLHTDQNDINLRDDQLISKRQSSQLQSSADDSSELPIVRHLDVMISDIDRAGESHRNSLISNGNESNSQILRVPGQSNQKWIKSVQPSNRSSMYNQKSSLTSISNSSRFHHLPTLDKQRLQGMIEDYKRRRNTEKESKVKDYHIMDNYIQVLTFLHQTNRFQKFFDPLRLKMMLIKPARLDDPNFLNNLNRIQVENFPNTFLVGCHLYQQGHFQKASDCFQKIVESKQRTLYYEARFNLGACLFKMAEFKMALKQFTTLLNEQKAVQESAKTNKKLQDVTGNQAFRKFIGRDRRLYFNKALCELQMGLFDQAIATCKSYLKPVKHVTRKVLQLEEQARFAKEHDEINEETQFDEMFDQQQLGKQKDQLKEHQSSIRRQMLNISRSNNMSLSPISESALKTGEQSVIHKSAKKNQQSKNQQKKKKSKLRRSFQVKYNQLACSSEELGGQDEDSRQQQDQSVTFQEQQSSGSQEQHSLEQTQTNASRISIRSQAQITTLDNLNKQRNKLRLLTQFQKKNCHPLNIHCHPMVGSMEGDALDSRSFEQIAKDSVEKLSRTRSFKAKNSFVNEEDLHPRYTEDGDNSFIREMYRLKGFAYLRNQQKLVSMQQENEEQYTDAEQGEHQLFVVKAASAFQKALGQTDGQVVHRLYNRMRKQQKAQKKRQMKMVDEQSQFTKIRATFINFRRKLEGALAEDIDEVVEEQVSVRDERSGSESDKHSLRSKRSNKNKQKKVTSRSGIRDSTPESLPKGVTINNSQMSTPHDHKRQTDMHHGSNRQQAVSPFNIETKQKHLQAVTPGLLQSNTKPSFMRAPHIDTYQKDKDVPTTAQTFNSRKHMNEANNYEDLETIFKKGYEQQTMKAFKRYNENTQVERAQADSQHSQRKSTLKEAVRIASAKFGGRDDSKGSNSSRQNVHRPLSSISRSHQSRVSRNEGARSQHSSNQSRLSARKIESNKLLKSSIQQVRRASSTMRGGSESKASSAQKLPQKSPSARITLGRLMINQYNDSSSQSVGGAVTNNQDQLSMPRFSEESPERQHDTDEPKDWLERHVRFIEDFTREGHVIKQKIKNNKQHRHIQQQSILGGSSSVDSASQLGTSQQPRHQRSIMLSNTNIKQVLGKRFNLDRIRERYAQHSQLAPSVSHKALSTMQRSSHGGMMMTQRLPIPAESTALTSARYQKTQQKLGKDRGNVQRTPGRISLPALPNLQGSSTQKTLRLPQIERLDSIQVDERLDHQGDPVADQYRGAVGQQQRDTQQIVNLTSNEIYKVPDAYAQHKSRDFTIDKTWVVKC